MHTVADEFVSLLQVYSVMHAKNTSILCVKINICNVVFCHTKYCFFRCFLFLRFSYAENSLNFNFVDFLVEHIDRIMRSRRTFSSLCAGGTASFAAATTDFISILCSLSGFGRLRHFL